MKDSVNSSHVAATIERFGHGSITTFGLREIADVEMWSGDLEGCLRARSLSGLIDELASDDLVAACAQSIAAVDQWQALISELLLTSEISPAAINVVRQVLIQRLPGHVLTKLTQAPDHAFLVCDAIHDGKMLRFRTDVSPSVDHEWLFIDLENAIDHAAALKVQISSDEVTVPLAPLFWFDQVRMACSAFIVVA